jgi:hypothetical protein
MDLCGTGMFHMEYKQPNKETKMTNIQNYGSASEAIKVYNKIYSNYDFATWCDQQHEETKFVPEWLKPGVKYTIASLGSEPNGIRTAKTVIEDGEESRVYAEDCESAFYLHPKYSANYTIKQYVEPKWQMPSWVRDDCWISWDEGLTTNIYHVVRVYRDDNRISITGPTFKGEMNMQMSKLVFDRDNIHEVKAPKTSHIPDWVKPGIWLQWRDATSKYLVNSVNRNNDTLNLTSTSGSVYSHYDVREGLFQEGQVKQCFPSWAVVGAKVVYTGAGSGKKYLGEIVEVTPERLSINADQLLGLVEFYRPSTFAEMVIQAPKPKYPTMPWMKPGVWISLQGDLAPCDLFKIRSITGNESDYNGQDLRFTRSEGSHTSVSWFYCDFEPSKQLQIVPWTYEQALDFLKTKKSLIRECGTVLKLCGITKDTCSAGWHFLTDDPEGGVIFGAYAARYYETEDHQPVGKPTIVD